MFLTKYSILWLLLIAMRVSAISYPNLKNLPVYSCKLVDKITGQYCSSVRITSNIFLTAKHCSAHFTESSEVACPEPANPAVFNFSSFTIESELEADDLIAIRSEKRYVGRRPRIPTTYDEAILIQAYGKCYALGYGVGYKGKIAFNDTENMLPNEVHRGQGPVQFGYSFSSNVLSLFVNSNVFEFNKAINPGDSGGGLICLDEAENEYLIGIHKQGSNSILWSDRSFSINLAFYREWLSELMKNNKDYQ